jgi:excisionase family DNA binding protein
VSGIEVTFSLSREQLEQIAERVAELLTERQAPTGEDPWLNSDQAAAYLGCPRSRIHDLVQLRRLHPHRDGRRLLFRRSDLDAYLGARR